MPDRDTRNRLSVTARQQQKVVKKKPLQAARDYPDLLSAARDYGYTSPRSYRDFRAANPNVYAPRRGQYLNRVNAEAEQARRRAAELAEQARIRQEQLAAEAAERARIAEMQRRQTEAEGILAQRRQRLAQPIPVTARDPRFSRSVEGAPEGFTLPVARYRGRNFDYRDRRYTPEVEEYQYMSDLPREQYEYFYGEQPSLAVDRRNAERRAQELAQRQAMYGGQTNPPAPTPTVNIPGEAPAAAMDRRFRQGQYGAQYEAPETRRFQEGQYGARFNRPPEANIPDYISAYEQMRQREVDTMMQLAPTRGEARRFQEGQYGDLFAYMQPERGTGGAFERGSGGALDITRPEPVPYTPRWIDRWLDQQTELSEEDLYMLQVVNAIEPENYEGGDYYSGGGGGGGGYSGGGGGGGGYTPYTYTPSSYGGGSNYRRSPATAYVNSMGLTTWRI